VRALHFHNRFLASHLPLMSRASYRIELITASLMPVALAMFEGGILGVIAKKAFHAPDLAISLISAGPVMANMTSFIWTRLARGRNRVVVVNIAQFGVVASLLVMAAAPLSRFPGLWILLIASIAGRICMTGIITARSDIWRANYPRSVRFHVIGNFTILTAAIISLLSIVVGHLMDVNEQSYRVIFPLAALVGLAGALVFRKLRWRRGKSLIQSEKTADATGQNGASARTMFRVLREDKHFRFYMICQFILGIANLSLMPPFIKALDETFNLKYGSSMALTTTIPIGLMVIALPFWSRFLTRVHIVQFRAVHSWFFVVAIMLTAFGVLGKILLFLYLSRIIIGIARGGGALAWNLGHHDFSSRQLAPIYMGIHVTLTGIRGMIGPFFGMLIYAGFNLPLGKTQDFFKPLVDKLSTHGWLITESGVLHVPGAGGYAFVFLGLLAMVAALGFGYQALTLAHASCDLNYDK